MKTSQSPPPFFIVLSKIIGSIDATNRFFGKCTLIAIFLATFISAGNAIIRHLFNWSSNGLLEIQWYLFAAVFLLGAGYTYLDDRHIRIDIISGHLSPRMKAYLELFGVLFFLFPAFSILLYVSFPTVIALWNENSSAPSGLPRYPIAILIPTGIILLLLQGFSQFCKNLIILYCPSISEIPLKSITDRKEDSKC